MVEAWGRWGSTSKSHSQLMGAMVMSKAPPLAWHTCKAVLRMSQVWGSMSWNSPPASWFRVAMSLSSTRQEIKFSSSVTAEEACWAASSAPAP